MYKSLTRNKIIKEPLKENVMKNFNFINGAKIPSIIKKRSTVTKNKKTFKTINDLFNLYIPEEKVEYNIKTQKTGLKKHTKFIPENVIKRTTLINEDINKNNIIKSNDNKLKKLNNIMAKNNKLAIKKRKSKNSLIHNDALHQFAEGDHNIFIKNYISHDDGGHGTDNGTGNEHLLANML